MQIRPFIPLVVGLLGLLLAACSQTPPPQNGTAPPQSGLWTRQFGSSGDDRARDVAVDSSGNIVVVGETHGTLPGQTSAGGVDAFVRKYDPSGGP